MWVWWLSFIHLALPFARELSHSVVVDEQNSRSEAMTEFEGL